MLLLDWSLGGRMARLLIKTDGLENETLELIL